MLMQECELQDKIKMVFFLFYNLNIHDYKCVMLITSTYLHNILHHINMRYDEVFHECAALTFKDHDSVVVSSSLFNQKALKWLLGGKTSVL